jgi:glycosyltransferase involved in cell wall biosynthesis
MNILILNWRDVKHPKSGGAELVTMEHAKGWVLQGHAVTWVTAGYEGAKSDEIVDTVRFVRRAGSQTIYLFAPIFLLLHAREYDVIVDEVHGFPFFSPLFTRKPVVVFIHEIAGEIWDFMYPFPVNKIGKLLENMYFRVYKHSFFWTDAPSTVDELVKRGIPRIQCKAIACPIVIDKKIRLSLKIQKEKFPTYTFVSRVVRMKGIEEVIKAFSFIMKEQQHAKLWIVGGGERAYIQQLREMMNEYGVLQNARFWGKVTDDKKLELMSRAHILLHASVKEGWGLVVLEAAHVGTPSVVYNVPGLCDVVKNRQTGIVLSDNSPHEMTREALRLYFDKKRYNDFQKNGKAWADSLKWEDVTKQSLALLQKAVQQIIQ